MSTTNPSQFISHDSILIEMHQASNPSTDPLLQLFQEAFPADPNWNLFATKKKQFLPKKEHSNSNISLDRRQLLYLCSFSSTNGKSPFNKDQTEKCLQSYKWHSRTAFWLKWGIPTFALASAASFISFISTTSANTSEQAGITGAITCVQAFALSVLGLVYTGTFPHAASDAANEKQNCVHQLEHTYTELAKELLDLHYSANEKERVLATVLAERINLKELKSAILFHLKEKEECITEPLKQAIEHIIEGKTPSSHDLRQYIKVCRIQ